MRKARWIRRSSYPSYDIPSAIVLADVDGDGRKDVLVTHSGWNRLGVYRQFPSGDFVAEELYAIPYASQYQPKGWPSATSTATAGPTPSSRTTTTGWSCFDTSTTRSLALAVTAPAGGTFYTGVAPHRPLDRR